MEIRRKRKPSRLGIFFLVLSIVLAYLIIKNPSFLGAFNMNDRTLFGEKIYAPCDVYGAEDLAQEVILKTGCVIEPDDVVNKIKVAGNIEIIVDCPNDQSARDFVSDLKRFDEQYCRRKHF